MYKVGVVTGTRAEYGLLRPVLRLLESSGQLAMELYITGAHLCRQHGYTVAEIEADGFAGAARLDILSQPVPGGRGATALRTALALEGFVAILREKQPDVLLCLGDRYEMLAAGQAAALLGIPVAHISGGDVTAGADDDWFRHCLTKMAKLHFPSCEAYRARIIRMGEAPGTVFNVGGLGDENIRSMALLPVSEVEQQLGLAIPAPYALVTLHPETAFGLPAGQLAARVLAALPQDIFWLFTGSNADAGGPEIDAAVAAWCKGRKNAAQVLSLGSLRYLSLMRGAALVLGNSSSGVVETPSLGVPAVNIGRRQAGRITGENVLHCPAETEAIGQAIAKARAPAFAAKAKQVKSPYNGGNTSGKIVDTLTRFLTEGRLAGPKEFYDGGAPE